MKILSGSVTLIVIRPDIELEPTVNVRISNVLQKGCVHKDGDVLPVATRQDVLLIGNPLLGGLGAATAAGFGLSALAEEAGMGTRA